MEDNFVNEVMLLHRNKKWREIVDNYHDHPERNKLLWVFPSAENFVFLLKTLSKLKCDKLVSVGCGSGLLEWLIVESTGIPVTGIEVDGAWWQCKYSPPTFIPLHFTGSPLSADTLKILNSTPAILFCYFNNGPAFKEYMEHYSGTVAIIIGPSNKGVHTNPQPFDDIGENWKLFDAQEVRSSKDYIAFYVKI